MEKNNIDKVTEVIDDILNGTNDPKNDVNGDGVVNIDDVTAAVDNALNGGGDETPAGDENEFEVNGCTFKMIDVEGGTFTMGSPNTENGRGTNEGPQHQVTLSSYKIGETQVTQALWQAVMGTNPSTFTGDMLRPVESVSWDDCQAFIAKLNELTGKNFRLPTEAEWEYAARGGNKSQGFPFPGCDTPLNGGQPMNYIWYKTNSSGTTHPVAQKQPNELGIYDMGGNVNEWTNDLYVQYTSDAQTDPQGAASGTFRMYRGGGYADAVKNCRCAFRYPFSPNFKRSFLGFRLAL